ncbi:hypothetical protein IFM89_005311 [Coptis chinensis]|uniref:Piwi domain-containing protein n=1 Tax=Coptis chinensis TaxID=261450 RepID=A0A835LIA6_9MAGN|nr:hypothetical protein IFM89_005311 [Coptis chinensis]
MATLANQKQIDGVGEGQFSQVLLNELDAIDKACASLQEGYLPPVTFVVVQKRQHTRTAVDSIICHPSEFDFYLCSHAGIQSTVAWFSSSSVSPLFESVIAAIDVRSVGCILMELMERKALFPRRDHVQQLRLLMETVELLAEVAVLEEEVVRLEEHPYLASLHNISDFSCLLDTLEL